MSLPNQHTYVRGTKDTDDAISQEKPLAIGNKIWMHDPNRNTALRSALRDGTREPTDEHFFFHLEDAPFQNWVEFVGSDESSQDTTDLDFAAGAGTKLQLGSRIFIPRTKEIIRFTEDFDSDGITSGDVGRNFGRGTATASLLKSGDQCLIIAPAHYQGFTMEEGLSNAMVLRTFATSEVSWPVQVANIENAERSRGGNPFKRALMKAIKQSKDQMEGELLFGGYKSVAQTSSAHPLTTSQGIQNFISTHDYSATTITRLDLWDILAEWTSLNPEGGAIWCSMAFKAMLAEWALQMTTITVDLHGNLAEGQIGMEITKLQTPFGKFEIVAVDLFNQEPNLMGTVFFVPRGRIAYRPLIHYEDLDVGYVPVNRDEIHAKEGEVYGVYGWQFFEEEMWATLSGLQFAA